MGLRGGLAPCSGGELLKERRELLSRHHVRSARIVGALVLHVAVRTRLRWRFDSVGGRGAVAGRGGGRDGLEVARPFIGAPRASLRVRAVQASAKTTLAHMLATAL